MNGPASPGQGNPDSDTRRGLSQLLPETAAQRAFAFTNVVNNIGTGLFVGVSALYFHQVAGLPITEIGLGLGCAGIVGLIGRVPIGRLADQHGPRGTYAMTLAVQGVMMSAYLLVRSFPMFVLAVCIYQLAAGGSTSSRGPLVRQLAGKEPAKFRAYLRSVNNLGLAAGAVLAGWALEVDTPAAFRLVVGGNALSFFLAAASLLAVPGRAPAAARTADKRWVALYDRRYLSVTIVNGLMNIQFSMLAFAVPLWIVEHTDAPRWTISARMIVNTVIIALFQVRATRGIDGARSAAKSFRTSGPIFLVSAVLVAITADLHEWWMAAAILLLAAAVHATGELRQQAGSMELAFCLAPADLQGQYQGVFSMGTGLSSTLGPSLLTLLCLDGGQLGWVALGVMFALLGLLMPRLAEAAGPAHEIEDENRSAEALPTAAKGV